MGTLVMTEAQFKSLTSLVFDGTGQQELTISRTEGNLTAFDLSKITVNSPGAGAAGGLTINLGVGVIAPTGSATTPVAYAIKVNPDVVIKAAEVAAVSVSSSAALVIALDALVLPTLSTVQPHIEQTSAAVPEASIAANSTPTLAESINATLTAALASVSSASVNNSVTSSMALVPHTESSKVATADISLATALTTIAPSIDKLAIASKVMELLGKAPAMVPAYGKSDSFLFDANHYLLKHPELLSATTLSAVVDHFKTTASQGSAPTAWFDPVYYANKWADLKALNLDAAALFAHYNLYGVWEGRSAGAAMDKFDGARYLKDNPDVAAYVDAHAADFLGSRSNGAIAHYMIYGAGEGRAAFDSAGLSIEPVALVGTPGGPG